MRLCPPDSLFEVSFRLFLAGLLAGGSLLLVMPVHAQRHYVEPYSIEEGLPQSQVYDILQDDRGYLWLGLFAGGVARFDGHSFTSLTVEDGLPNNSVFVLHEDRSGTLWFGARRGLARYDGQSVQSFTVEEGLPGNTVNAIAEGPQDRLWFGTPKGVVSYDGNRFVPLMPDRLPGTRHLGLAAQGDTLWIGTDEGLYRYDGTTLTKLGSEAGLPTASITTLTTGSSGTLWIVTDQGVFRRTNARFERLDGTEDLTVHDVLVTSEQGVWIGAGDGLYRHADGKLRSFASQLTGTEVQSLYRDREGTLWIGTNLEGLYKYTPNPFDHFTTEDGLPSNIVWNMTRGPDEDLWIATEEAVSRFDGTSFTKEWGKEALNGEPYVLQRVGDDSLLIGSRGGLFVYDGKTLTAQTVDGEPLGTIYQIAEGAPGVYWVATPRGLVRYDGATLRRYTEEDGLSGNHMWTVETDRQGRVWIGHGEGVDRFDGDTVTTLNVAPYITGQARISAIEVDSDGYAWFGTRSGVYLKPPTGTAQPDSLRHFSTRDRLIDNNVYFLLLDRKGHLWVGTNRGLNRLDIRAYKETGEMPIRTYGKKDGFLGVETNATAAYRDQQGLLWFGTVGGLTRYNPSEDLVNEVHPPVRILDVRLFSEEASLDGSPKKTPWEHLPAGLRLSHDKNHLSFRYVGLSYTAPEDVSYRYKLDGLDQEWSPPTSQRQATYANIPPGSYTFKVKAANSDGVWSREPATYSLTITPPFWQTNWFYALCVLPTCELVRKASYLVC